MKKILVVGCGYVGSAAATALKSLGYFITVTTRSSQKIPFLKQFSDQVLLLEHPLDWAKYIDGQDRILLSVAPDHWKASLEDPLEIYRSTYLNTAKTLIAALKKNSSVEQVIYTSSTSVYNGCISSMVREDQELSPVTPQAQILLETEKVLLEILTPKKTTIFRLGEIVGPGRTIEARLQNAKTPFPGDGQNITNLIYLEDIVQATYFAITHQLQGIYNLCNDFHPTREKFYQQICEKLQIPLIKWDPSKKTFHGGKYEVSNAKIKETGYVFIRPGYVFPQSQTL